MDESLENPYAASRRKTLEGFGAYLSGSDAGLFAVLAAAMLDDAARNALTKTAEALGYGPDGATFLIVDAADPPLMPAQVFEAVEGLDPLCVVVCDKATADLVGAAYRQDIPTTRCSRLFGRDACAFDDLNVLLRDEQGKRHAWELLRSLMKRP